MLPSLPSPHPLLLRPDTNKKTPAISNSFVLDGVVTLVDAKNILPRLKPEEETAGGEEAEGKGDEERDAEVNEAFQQIMFSDRIVVNKVSCSSTALGLEREENNRKKRRYKRRPYQAIRAAEAGYHTVSRRPRSGSRRISSLLTRLPWKSP